MTGRTDAFFVEPRKPLTKLQRAKLFAEHDGICCICKTKIDAPREKWIDEHVIPLSRGGTNDMDNRGPAHERCATVKTKADKAGLAKDRRLYANHIGAKDKPKGRPMAGTKASGWKKTFNNGWVRRDD